MEANVCEISQLDANALLPPRKRLLAGLKKQNFDSHSFLPSPSAAADLEFHSRLDRLLRSRVGDPNLSSEEIIESSRLAAEAAVKVAVAARATAEEKAVKASKALAAAKSALELVAIAYDDEAGGEISSSRRKNKIKKHIPVELLYDNKHEFVEDCRTDEELARNLHRVINSSPRITKNPSSPKGHKHKKPKTTSSSVKPSSQKAVGECEQNEHCTSNGNNVVTGGLQSESLIPEEHDARVIEHTSIHNKPDQSRVDKLEPSKRHAKDNFGGSLDDTFVNRKRKKLKQKKLLLSVCNYRDQTKPMEEMKSRSNLETEVSNISRTPVGNKPLFSVGCTSNNGMVPVDKISAGKCLGQALKVTTPVEQNKVMQS